MASSKHLFMKFHGVEINYRMDKMGRGPLEVIWSNLPAQDGNPICLNSAFGDIRKTVSDQRGVGQVGNLLKIILSTSAAKAALETQFDLRSGKQKQKDPSGSMDTCPASRGCSCELLREENRNGESKSIAQYWQSQSTKLGRKARPAMDQIFLFLMSTNMTSMPTSVVFWDIDPREIT
ncbi:hypothetical protein WISP_67769 [Willisornis vidua]|uniref:Uncharacterized protein n=1 Tax=Willisornis vidua TaxID=1566151 RepID=A0ABQ9DD61_9PASS|nr:hypothetical protein WISP_67769 [Willisornis vidua]